MPRKTDPIVAVLRYFEDADEACSDQAYALVKEIRRRKHPKPVAKPKRKKPMPTTTATGASTAATAIMPAAAPSAPKRHRIRPPAAPPVRREEDVPLPGIVSEVGGQ